MHKKLAADLTSLAHSILQMKNKEDVFALKTKAHEVYEKLALLAYVEEYINTTPNITTTKETLIAEIIDAEKNIETNTEITVQPEEEIVSHNATEELSDTTDNSPPENEIKEEIPFTVNQPVEEPFVQDSLFAEPEIIPSEKIVENEIIEQPFDELEDILFGEPTIKDEAAFIEEMKAPTLETEIVKVLPQEKPLIQPDETEVFEEEIITENEPSINTPEIESEVTLETENSIEEEESPTLSEKLKTPTLEEELGDTISVDVMANLFEKAPPKTLNDSLQNTIKIDLNDRIAFVKNLFEGNQEDFNRVISQLNTIKTEKIAKEFIFKMVKPDYDWSDKEDYETRLLEIIERRFS